MRMRIIGLLIGLALACDAPAVQERRGGSGPGQGGVIPLIVMDSVPLRDAVKNLARQAGLNCIIDYKVIASFEGPGGEFEKEPMVKGHWEKVTAEQALNELLAGQKLKIVTNTTTGVGRIVFAKDEVKPPATNQVESGDGAIIPLIVMDQVSLRDAIVNLARQAQLQVELDSQLTTPGSAAGGKALSQVEVSFRWQKVTARQALDALLENYGLVLVKGAGGTGAWMVTRGTEK